MLKVMKISRKSRAFEYEDLFIKYVVVFKPFSIQSTFRSGKFRSDFCEQNILFIDR